MKGAFVLIFLSAIASSLQQQNLLLQRPFPALNYLNYFNPLHHPEGQINERLYGRRNNYVSSPENRAFGVKIAAYNYLNDFIGLTVTSTLFETTSSTLTVGTLDTCYASALFSTKVPCRRRREVIAVLKALKEMNKDIEPSEVLPVVPTEAVDTIPSLPGEIMTISSPDLLSSIEEKKEESNKVAEVALDRFKRFTAKTTTVTATVTSYIFYTTTATSTFQTDTLAAADDFLCVPGGFKLC